MKQVNIHEAKTKLSKLLEKVESGEQIIIANRGIPKAILSRYVSTKFSWYEVEFI